jgi:hypothetical protein
MAIGIYTRVTQGSLDMYDAVNAKIGMDSEPPDGLIAHAAGELEGGGFQLIDIWESREAHEKFTEEKLRPAIDEVTQGQAGPPEQTFFEVHSLIKP